MVRHAHHLSVGLEQTVSPVRPFWKRAGQASVEQRFPDPSGELILYCGGGFRSALAADNLQKMGYTNVTSMDGGIRDWRNRGYPLTSGA